MADYLIDSGNSRIKILPMAEAAPDLIFNGMLRYIELSGL